MDKSFSVEQIRKFKILDNREHWHFIALSNCIGSRKSWYAKNDIWLVEPIIECMLASS
jgi:hypothetical protein